MRVVVGIVDYFEVYDQTKGQGKLFFSTRPGIFFYLLSSYPNLNFLWGGITHGRGVEALGGNTVQ